MRVLITGGAGFVGSNLSLRLKDWHPEWQVVALDNLRRRGAELNLPRLRNAGVEFIHGDVREEADFPVEPVDVIIDCAAEPSVLAGISSSPRYVIDANLGGTLHSLEHARQTGALLILLSTSRVYPVERLNRLNVREEAGRFTLEAEQTEPGASEHGISEAFSLEGARSIYGATKLCAELMCQEYSAAYGLRTIVNRCGVLAGPWQMGRADQGVFALWMAAHVYGLPLKYIGWGGCGKQVRDLLHVDDLCRLIDIQLREPDRFPARIYNVGGGVPRSLSLLETTRLCGEITGARVQVAASTEERAADIRTYVTDSRLIADQSGWSPQRGPREVLEDLYRWICDNRELLRPVLAG